MRSFLARAFHTLPPEILTPLRAGFYFAEYAMREEPNLETAYGAMVFRKILHDPLDFHVATLERKQINGLDEFVKSKKNGQTGQDGPTIADVIDAFEQGIARLYGQPVLDERQRWLECYSRFFGFLLEDFRLGVVTTNYDLVTETALSNIGRESSYVYSDDAGSRETVPILKLHGSVNWPKRCNLDLRDIPPEAPPLPKAYVLPPTWDKDLNKNRLFASVWCDAVNLIGEAQAILIIGQSFPPTDLHLDYLFAEALARRDRQSKGKRVTVADRNLCTASRVCERFRRYQTVGYAAAHPVPFEQLLDELERGNISL